MVIGSKIKPNSCGDPEAAVAGTLSRLGVDCVDLYMVGVERPCLLWVAVGVHQKGGHRNRVPISGALPRTGSATSHRPPRAGALAH